MKMIKIYVPLKAKVMNIYSDTNKLEKGTPGGLIGIELDIDPGLTSDDGLVGNIILKNGNGITQSMNLQFHSSTHIWYLKCQNLHK